MNVRAFLRTPLHRGRATSVRRFELDATVVEVTGEATLRDGGLDVVVAKFYSERGDEVASPWPRIFLPGSKIDFYVVE